MTETVPLHFESYGAGEPLVLLHGLFGSLDNWHAVGQKLADHFRVLAVDQRNHGRSPHTPQMDYPLMAEDLRALLQRLGLAQTRVLGHSMGGKTAMEYALRYPETVTGLVVVDLAPHAYAPIHQPMLDALLALDLAACQSRHQMDLALTPAIPQTAVRQFLLKSVTRGPDGHFTWKMNLRGINDNYPRLGDALTAGRTCEQPALFLRGGDSNYLIEEDFPLIRQLFPQAAFTTIPGAGHWVHADAPAEFLRLVREFLLRPAGGGYPENG